MLNAVTGTKLDLNGEEEVVDMCKAIEDMRRDERMEGRIEGREEGALKKAREVVAVGHAMGMAEDMIAKLAGVSIELVRQWLAPEGA